VRDDDDRPEDVAALFEALGPLDFGGRVDALAAWFARAASWEDRYGRLLRLGAALPPMPPGLRVDAHRQPSCAARIWFVQQRAADGSCIIEGDSDSALVRGVLALLRALFAGCRDPGPALEALQRLGVAGLLPAQRCLGLHRLIERAGAGG
jgi:cysteine desulfuration protein SufE